MCASQWYRQSASSSQVSGRFRGPSPFGLPPRAPSPVPPGPSWSVWATASSACEYVRVWSVPSAAVGPGALGSVDLQGGREVGEDGFRLDRLLECGALGPQWEGVVGVREVEQVRAGVGPVAPADLRERPAQSQSVENLLTVRGWVVQCHGSGLLPCDRDGQAVAVVTSPCSCRSWSHVSQLNWK